MTRITSPEDLEKLLLQVSHSATPLTEDQLASYTAAACNWAKEEIAERQELRPFTRFIIANTEGNTSTIHVPLPAEMMESPRLKTVLFQSLAVIGKRLGALAVITVSDALSLSTPDEWRTTKPESWWREIVDFAAAHGVEETAAAGYGRAVEIIAACGQTKQHLVLHSQEYERRNASGDVIAPTRNALRGAGSISIRCPNPAQIIRSSQHLPDKGSRMMSFYEGPLAEDSSQPER